MCGGGWVFVCVSEVCLVPAAEINCKLDALSFGDRFTHMAVAPASKQPRGGGVRSRWAVLYRCCLSAGRRTELDAFAICRVTPTVWVSHELYVLRPACVL